MKLLIVDDEELTRHGLMNSINWKELGIHTVLQADDGIHGLQLASKYKPEIILSDVRMPRMNGVEMADKLKTLLPAASIIFMSGYTDREYLKAAIRLKAISYVDKPIDPSEVILAIREAVIQVKSVEESLLTYDSYMDKKAARMALMLLYPEKKGCSYAKNFEEIHKPVKTTTFFTTLVINTIIHLSDISPTHMDNFYKKAKEKLQILHLDYLYADKQDEYIIFHIFSPSQPSAMKLKHFSDTLSELLIPHTKYFIGIGKTVIGAHKLYESYNCAVILMQNSFFMNYNSILAYSDDPVHLSQMPADITSDFLEALSKKDRSSAFYLTDELYRCLSGSHSLLVHPVKNMYYKLFSLLHEASQNMHIHIPSFTEKYELLLEDITQSINLSDLHQLLHKKLTVFFTALTESREENSIIFIIKEFINQNYQNEYLSVKDISEHVFLSSSYVCTIFKSETGQTLNQYLTEYRIEKAKKLLDDPRYKINDISAKVGYSDGNYFGKTFKKVVGLSPSEYREKDFI